MNGLEIDLYLKEIREAKKGHYGVYSADTIPSVETFPTGFIVNTDDSNSPGEHWVAFYYEKPNKLAEYFDSYGLQPLKRSFLQALPEKYKYSTHTIQSLFSMTCGLYCLFYIKKRAENKSLQEVISCFTSDPDWNDQKIEEYFSKKPKEAPFSSLITCYNNQTCSTKSIFFQNLKKRN